jgi:hypothetical protein
MSCAGWEERIAAEFDGTLSPEVVEHVGACPACATLLDGLERDRAALGTAPADALAADYASLRQGLRAAIEQRAIFRQRLARRYVPALLAAAAVVVLALVLPRPQAHRQVAMTTPGSAPTPPATLTPAATAVSPHTPPQSHKEAKRRAKPANTPSIDLALWERVTGQSRPPDDGSESNVEMQIETANPNVRIILLRAKEGSDE